MIVKFIWMYVHVHVCIFVCLFVWDPLPHLFRRVETLGLGGPIECSIPSKATHQPQAFDSLHASYLPVCHASFIGLFPPKL